MAYTPNARQSLVPNQFPRTRRPVAIRTPSSINPGLEVPMTIAQVMREEQVTGSVGIAMQMAEMPKPLLNSVSLRVRAWFVPYTAFDRFPSLESFVASWAGEPERPDMEVIPTFNVGKIPQDSEIAQVLGLQYSPDDDLNVDFVEAYNQVINHERRNISMILADETLRELDDHTIARATWINHLFADVKPTFDEASVEGLVPLASTGSTAGLTGDATLRDFWAAASTHTNSNNPDGTAATNPHRTGTGDRWRTATVARDESANGWVLPSIDLSKISVDLGEALGSIRIADIDRGRVIAQLAKIRDRFAGHEEVRHIDALMQGYHIPFEDMRRPVLLNEARTQFSTVERHATDGPSLDQSVTVGVASVQMSVTVPATVTGGYIVVTAAAMPDQIFERRRDPMLYTTSVDEMPNALSDMLDIHKVEVVKTGDVDLMHDEPEATYGYAPLNIRFARPVDRVGGYFRDKPENMEHRAQLWISEVENPVFGQNHYLCPRPFPKDVFADTNADAFETRTLLACTGTGIVQFGPQVLEDQGSYAALIEFIQNEELDSAED